MLQSSQDSEGRSVPVGSSNKAALWLELPLEIKLGGGFTVGLIPPSTDKSQTTEKDIYTPSTTVPGKFKPLPEVSKEDATFIDKMIAEKYVPYQNIPEGAGKTVQELKALGERLFPFSHFSLHLAMCVYDWTTASFARLVFMKIFQYTGIEQTPFPVDQPSIAQQIWMSKWGTYTPQDPYFMKSFMMKPASSQPGRSDTARKCRHRTS
ncbi:hypothetical protein VTN00DRAFT_8937 [Thermoascus crustaceus]|uniref:uncharacterized protein n=1 Tax=Thermoascus crustaceus TaxID=5088 RepID=UPI0037422DB3